MACLVVSVTARILVTQLVATVASYPYMHMYVFVDGGELYWWHCIWSPAALYNLFWWPTDLQVSALHTNKMWDNDDVIITYSGDQYVCTGNLTNWTKCMFSTREPSRVKWVIPDTAKEASTFLLVLVDLSTYKINIMYLYRKAYKPRVKQRVYGQKLLPQDSTDSGPLPFISSATTIAMDTTT